jgi:hypothetical protein
MATSLSGWYGRHHTLVARLGIALVLLVVAVESFFLYQEVSINRAAKAQSAKLLTTFLQGDTVRAAGASGVLIRLQNVRFKWSDKVYIDTGDMAVRAVPMQGSTVNFDDLNSFLLTIQRSVVLIRPDVLEGMFNESVFNYPESKVRDLKVTLTQKDGVQTVRLKGDINVVTWIPFTMDTHLSVDRSTNTLVIDVDHLKILGFFSATRLIKWKPFHLDRMMTLPPNKSLMVEGNRMMVKPFGLFPPPRVNGTMSDVSVDGKMIRLTFSGNPIPAPESPGKNYVYLKGGTSQFGHFRMLDTDILIRDRDQGDRFVFSLLGYARMIPKSTIDIENTRSVRVTMPDF